VTLEEALDLAECVEESTDWTVTAIGRFLMLDELQQACASGVDHKLPWLVSIMAVGDIRTLIKLTSIQDWSDLQDSATKRPKRETKPPVRETKAAKNESNAAQAAPAGMLF
jgi:hypothetical protein